MAGEWRNTTVRRLVEEGILERPIDGNHGEIHPKTVDFVEHGIPFVMASDLAGGRVDITHCAFISEEQARSLRKGFALPGDVLISHKATMGRTALVQHLNVPFLILTPQVTYYRVKDPSRLVARYLKFYFDSPQFQALFDTWGQKGSTRAYLGITAQLDLPIVLPPPDEQRTIAHTLGTLDDKIELNRRMNETLEGIARAIFKSWFVDFDPVRAKASGETPESICRRLGLTPDLLVLFPDRLVDSELGEIPEGWETTALRSVADVTKGKSYKSSELGPSATALVTLKSFNRGGGYRLDGLKEYTGTFRREQEVFAGDLIVAYTDVTQAADVVGKPALIVSDSRYEHLVISLDVAVIRPRLPTYRPFLYGLMSNEAFQQYTRAHTTGTTVLHLAAGAVPGFNFPWPGERLVEEYSALARPIFELMDIRVGEARSLESTRDALLPKLLAGELRIPLAGGA